MKFVKGQIPHNYKGGRSLSSHGFVRIVKKDHPRAMDGMYVYEHILVAERALGRYLPLGVIVHHHDENRQNNDSYNLVICQNNAYHRLLHVRLKAFRITGNATMRHCRICGSWDMPDNMYRVTYTATGSTAKKNNSESFYHNQCATDYQRELKLRKGGGINVT